MNMVASIAIGNSLRSNARSWNNLAGHERTTLYDDLMPSPSFNTSQRTCFSNWWLPVTSNQINEINQLCPPFNKVSGRSDINGNLFIGADLLSDSVNNGRLRNILSILGNLAITHKEIEDWPSPDQTNT